MSDDDAIKRREKLQALRSKRVARSESSGNETENSIAPRAIEKLGQGKEGRAKLLKLLAERRQSSGEGEGGAAKRPLLAKLLGGQVGRGGEGGGEGKLEQFPRLKQLLSQRRGQGAGVTMQDVTVASSPKEITRYKEQLEQRLNHLEATLKTTMDKLAKVESLQSDPANREVDSLAKESDN